MLKRKMLMLIEPYPIKEKITRIIYTSGEEEVGRSKHRLKKLYPSRILKGSAHQTQLEATLRYLSESDWYYGNITRKQSIILLQGAPVGQFLLRDSSDPRFLFSISVQTALGPTSVRIHYVDGMYKLDSEPSLACVVPSFPTLFSLIDYYVSLGGPQLCISGSKYKHVLLSKPLYKKFPSLKQLCRFAINNVVTPKDIAPLPIPTSLKQYLQDYPYTR